MCEQLLACYVNVCHLIGIGASVVGSLGGICCGAKAGTAHTNGIDVRFGVDEIVQCLGHGRSGNGVVVLQRGELSEISLQETPLCILETKPTACSLAEAVAALTGPSGT